MLVLCVSSVFWALPLILSIRLALAIARHVGGGLWIVSPDNQYALCPSI